MYDKKIDDKWNKKWKETNITKFNKENVDKKYYCLEMFSYPSGARLHLGHWYNYGPVDTFARFKKMQGYEVFQPMGFDAFGLPAENYAIKTGIHPKDSTLKNIETMEEQLNSIGALFNFDAEVVTCNEDYYKWTQWLFLKLLEKGLAYRKKANVNFCPSCNTVLANEQVIDGECERCSSEIIHKDLTQWFFKITDYAEELLEKVETLDWPEKTKKIQKNWIGKSTGSTVKFKVDGQADLDIEVFTTRVDTLCGVTYVVVAPENEIVDKLTTEENKKAVEEYIEKTRKATEIDRLSETREKTGVFTGSYAINPVTHEKVPVWIADYVLSTYGTGCVMAVPAHDERDGAFAKKYNLPVKQVIAPVFIGEEDRKTRGDKETVKRKVINVIAHFEDEYVVLNWEKSTGWKSFVNGGIEGDESCTQAAIRELKEETGYVDVKNIYEINARNIYKGYLEHKDINRVADTTVVVVELASLKKVDVEEFETINHVSELVKKAELYDYLNLDSQKYGCEIYLNNTPYTGEGELVNSGDFDGISTSEAKIKITEYLKSKNAGDFKVTYRLRDWLVSRQRYWGAPIPVIYCETCGTVPVPEKDLPVKLPYDVEFKPDGKSPLAKSEEFVNTVCPKCNKKAKREVDTLDTFVCSSWYQFRYPDNKNENEAFDTEWINKMLPVDKYVGGPEHAAMHLLYARFITKVLRDLGYVNCSEPFTSLTHQGLILGPDGNKMSKSKGNVISPDEYIEKYGSDVFRMYLMFAFAYTEGGPWSTEGIASMSKFALRLERIIDKIIELENNEVSEISSDEKELLYVFNNSLKCITYDLENMQFNTGIARIMEIVNELYSYDLKENKNVKLLKDLIQKLLMILSPFMPHFAEEKWEKLNNKYSIVSEKWPEVEEKYLVKDEIEIAVQVNGVVRFRIDINSNLNEKEIEDVVVNDERLQKYMDGKQIKKIIVIKNKIVNVVI